MCCPGDDSPPAAARVRDLRSSPAARPDQWLDVHRYQRHGAPIGIQSRRGCAFACTYCTYRMIEGSRYRLREPEAVADEIRGLVRVTSARRFDAVDATFNQPTPHALAVCEAIARSGVKARLHATSLNPAGTSPELLTTMKRAGFRTAMCSAESGSERMLLGMRKGFSVEDIARTAEAARAAGVAVLWMFMFGAPGESEETVRETLRFVERELRDDDRLICTTGIRVYPGTEVASLAVSEGALAPDADLTRPFFYCSPHIRPERILEMLDASARRRQMVHLQTVQQPVVAIGERVWSTLGLRRPMWSAIPLYNRLLRPFTRE